MSISLKPDLGVWMKFWLKTSDKSSGKVTDCSSYFRITPVDWCRDVVLIDCAYIGRVWGRRLAVGRRWMTSEITWRARCVAATSSTPSPSYDVYTPVSIEPPLMHVYNKKVAYTILPSIGFRSWSRFLAVSLQVTTHASDIFLVYWLTSITSPV